MPTRSRRVLPATEVKNRFGQVLRELSRTGGPIIVERDGKQVAAILSIELFERLYARLKPGRERRALAQSAFGMWAEREDIDDHWLARSRTRWRSAWKDE